MRNSSRWAGREAGQGMTEYIIILALIAIAAVGVYSFFGRQGAHEQGAAKSAASQPPAKSADTGSVDRKGASENK